MKRKQKNTIQVELLLMILLCLVVITTILLVYQFLSRPSSSAAATAAPTASAAAMPAATLAPVDPLIAADYTSSAYAPTAADNTTSFTSGWTTSATDGSLSAVSDFENKNVTVSYAGSDMNACSLYRDGVPLLQGNHYTLYFNASASYARTITAAFVNADDSSIYASSSFSLSTAAASYQLDLDMSSATTYNGRVVFYVGNDSSEQAKGSYTLSFSGIRVLNQSGDKAVTVKVNQVGYQLEEQKRCTFQYDEGDVFDVVNADTNAVVYSGAVVGRKAYESTGETNYYGDFTNVTVPGTYYIRTQIGDVSYSFTISSTVYASLQNDVLKFLSLQRCGSDLNASWAGAMAHLACHTAKATIIGTDSVIDVTGGWHDAGDYGRYIKTGSKAAMDLLLSYMINPQFISDGVGIAESNNGVSDILDEARYELEWMLKMQAPDGGVYNKVLTTSVAGVIDPAADSQQLWAMDEETTASGDFAGTMALASAAYEKVDPEFSAKCLSASKSAYAYLSSQLTVIDVKNSGGVNGGEYIDNEDSDERFYAAGMLYAVTGDASYLNDAKTLYQAKPSAASGIGWKTVGAYGKYIMLVHSSLKTDDPDFYAALKTSLTQEADTLMAVSSANSYQTSLSSYLWGSNSEAADNGVFLCMAYDVTGVQDYRNTAVEQLNYICGKNALNMCFVTGYGSNSPHHIHSRTESAFNTAVSGALAGGADSSREDNVTGAIDSTVPAAKVYADSWDSYSTNEAAIYYNSALLQLLARLS